MALVYNLQSNLGRLLLLTLSFVSLHMCIVCMHVCIYIHIYMYMFVCCGCSVHVGALSWYSICSSIILYFIEARSLPESWVHWFQVVWLASLPRDPLSLPPECRDYKLNHTSPAFLWVLEIWTPIFMPVQQAFFTDHLSRLPLILSQKLRGGKLWSRPLT